MYCGQRLSASSLPSRRHRVGDEHQVELAALGGLRDLGVMSEIGAGVDLRVRVQPGSQVVPGRVKERTELHRLAATPLVHAISPPEFSGQAYRVVVAAYRNNK